MGADEMSDIVQTGFRFPWVYQRQCVVDRLIGVFRVLIGRNASIPKGSHNTDTKFGIISVRGFYGGCILSLPQVDLYWTSQRYTGWGAGPRQAKFEAIVDQAAPKEGD